MTASLYFFWGFVGIIAAVLAEDKTCHDAGLAAWHGVIVGYV